jgi:hypothetical protein
MARSTSRIDRLTQVNDRRPPSSIKKTWNDTVQALTAERAEGDPRLSSGTDCWDAATATAPRRPGAQEGDEGWRPVASLSARVRESKIATRRSTPPSSAPSPPSTS